MGYSIIFQTKIVKLSDGRLLHLDLSGCNNDDEGRRRDDWNGKIYTREEFIKKAESFKEDSKPSKETKGFDLKIGSRYCTYYDYGEHLLRMLKRAVTFDELMHSGKYISFDRVDGAEVEENGKMISMSLKDFTEYLWDKMYNGGCTYRMNYTFLNGEKKIVDAFDSGAAVRIYISK